MNNNFFSNCALFVGHNLRSNKKKIVVLQNYFLPGNNFNKNNLFFNISN